MATRLSNKSRAMSGTIGTAMGHKKSVKKAKPRVSQFAAGGECFMKNVGYGLTSYEKATVEKVNNGSINVKGLDYPYNSQTGSRIDPGDLPNLGLTVTLCVTPEDIEAAKQYVSQS